MSLGFASDERDVEAREQVPCGVASAERLQVRPQIVRHPVASATASPRRWKIGFGMSNGQREYSLGWRLGLAQGGPTALELPLEATRREDANDNDDPDLAAEFRLRSHLNDGDRDLFRFEKDLDQGLESGENAILAEANVEYSQAGNLARGRLLARVADGLECHLNVQVMFEELLEADDDQLALRLFAFLIRSRASPG